MSSSTNSTPNSADGQNGDEEMSTDVMDQLLVTLNTGEMSNLNWQYLFSDRELETTLLELAKKVTSGGNQSRHCSGNGDCLDNYINTANGINDTNQENGIKVKPYAYLSLLTEIMSQLLRDPEAKEADFNRWMLLTSFDGTNVTIIDLVFGIIPLCTVEFAIPVLLPSHLPSRQVASGTTATSSRSSLKDHIVPILSAFIFRLPVESFDKVELALLKNLLDPNSLKAIIAADIWCLISRSNDELRIQTIDMLMKIRGVISSSYIQSSSGCIKSSDSVRDHKVIAIEVLLNRLLRFHAEFDLDAFLNKIDIFDHTYLISGLKNLPQPQLSKMVKKASVKYFSKEEINVQDLAILCELISFQEEPDHLLVTKVLSVCLKSESDQSTFQVRNCHQVRSCLLMLSKFLKVKCINEIVTNCESTMRNWSGKCEGFETVYFVFQLVHSCAERIGKSSKYGRSIIEKSFSMMNEMVTNSVMRRVWLELAYKLCRNVRDGRLIIEYFSVRETCKSPLGPRILFHKFMSKEDDMTAMEETDLTVQALSCVSHGGKSKEMDPFPLLVSPERSKKSSSEEIEVVFESRSQEAPSSVDNSILSSLTRFRETLNQIAQNPTLLDQHGRDLADIAILINGILREPEE